MRQLCKGNVAVIKGAVLAGCRAYYGYPITPASEVAEAAALYLPEVGGTFVQAESETASINMVYGAASAGVRVMTASSGPGLSLMQEGISYLAGAELPCVIVDVMRGGPGLGNIAPEQSDYFAMVKGGGHGNYRNIVVAPASVQEMAVGFIRVGAGVGAGSILPSDTLELWVDDIRLDHQANASGFAGQFGFTLADDPASGARPVPCSR